jgi:hypothetical protein
MDRTDEDRAAVECAHDAAHKVLAMHPGLYQRRPIYCYVCGAAVGRDV